MSGVLEHQISDHLPTFILKKKEKRVKTLHAFKGRKYANLESGRVTERLEETDIDLRENCKDPEQSWQLMQTAFLAVADEECPMTSFSIKTNKPPYLLGQVGKEMDYRDGLYHRARSRKHDKQLWEIARRQKIKVRTLIRKAKKVYINKQLLEHANDSKKYWVSIASMIKPRTNQHLSEVICPVTNEPIKGLDAARLINGFFCVVGENLASKIPETSVDFDWPTTYSELTWYDRIPVDEVLNRINELNIGKSSGIPTLGSKILKVCLRCKVHLFTKLLNMCVQLGKFPGSWKQAIVVPIPKGAKKPLLDNIRPISLLPYPGKIWQRPLTHWTAQCSLRRSPTWA